MDVNYVLLLITALIMALAYGLIGFFADKLNNGSTFNWPKFFATIVYSIIVGVIAVNTGLITLQNVSDYSAIFSPVWAMYGGIYLGLIYVFSKIVVPITKQFTSRTELYPRKFSVDPERKMDQETRHWLISDQPTLGQAILAKVDEAESKKTYRYAIEAGAWIYLVEFGEVTGSKHYFFKAWFGTGQVNWKPISVDCLETIRKTGKFPDYGDLY